MSFELRPFHLDDLRAIVNRDGEQVAAEFVSPEVVRHPAMTICIDGKPVGCGGVLLLWPGVGHVWLRLSTDMKPYMKSTVKAIRLFLRDVQRVYRLHRVEGEVLQDSLRNQRFMEWLGFTAEKDGVARQLLASRQSMIRYEMVGD